jgi:hypothetical protein
MKVETLIYCGKIGWPTKYRRRIAAARRNPITPTLGASQPDYPAFSKYPSKIAAKAKNSLFFEGYISQNR